MKVMCKLLGHLTKDFDYLNLVNGTVVGPWSIDF